MVDYFGHLQTYRRGVAAVLCQIAKRVAKDCEAIQDSRKPVSDIDAQLKRANFSSRVLPLRRRCSRVRVATQSISLMLAIVVCDTFMSGVTAANAAQTRKPTPTSHNQSAIEDLPAVGRTSSEKVADDLDRQLRRKLNICRGC